MWLALASDVTATPILGRSRPAAAATAHRARAPASPLSIHTVDQCLDAVEVQHLAGSIPDYPTIVLGRNMEKVPGSDIDLLALIDLHLGSAGQDDTNMLRWAVPCPGGCWGSVRPFPPWQVAPLANDCPPHSDQLESALIEH